MSVCVLCGEKRVQHVVGRREGVQTHRRQRPRKARGGGGGGGGVTGRQRQRKGRVERQLRRGGGGSKQIIRPTPGWSCVTEIQYLPSLAAKPILEHYCTVT